MNKYRIVEETLNNGSTKYRLEASYSVFSTRWESINTFNHLEDAKRQYNECIKWQEEADGRRIKLTKVVFP